MPSLFEKIYEIILRIPKGKVATYGQVAALAGNPRAARMVGWVLNAHPGNSDLPWQRVINASGKSSLPTEAKRKLQRALLEAEGIVFEDERVNLDVFLWDGQ
ncbi:MAG: MGMT family protein [bacterium]